MKTVAALVGFACLFVASTTFADTKKKCRVDVSIQDGEQYLSGEATLDDVEIKRKNAEDARPRSQNIRDYEIPANKFRYSGEVAKGKFNVVVRFQHVELYERSRPEETNRVWLELAIIQPPKERGGAAMESTSIRMVETRETIRSEVRQTIGTKKTSVQLVCGDPLSEE